MPKWTVNVTTPPAAPNEYPVTLDQVKAHVSIASSETAFDTMVQDSLSSATYYGQQYAGRSFLTQTLTLKMDRFPRWNAPIQLPYGPVQSVTSLSYVDTDGDTQVWDSANYIVDSDSDIPRITPSYNTDYPDARAQVNAVIVVYVAGYGSTGASVPAVATMAIKQYANHWFENRGAVLIGTIQSAMLIAGDALLRQIRQGLIIYDD